MGDHSTRPDFVFDGPRVDKGQFGPWAPPDPLHRAPEPKSADEDLLYSTAGSKLAAQIRAERLAAQSGPFVQQPYGEVPSQSSWEVGLIGESLVAGELSRLRELDHAWGFLNSIGVGQNGADIDHLLIGPGGVFTINTKHHANCKLWVAGSVFMVNGHKHPYIRNSRHEAARASRLLSKAMRRHIPVTGVIAPVRAKSLVVREIPGDVRVIQAEHLAGFFSSIVPTLTPDQVKQLFEHARAPDTWSSVKPPAPRSAPPSAPASSPSAIIMDTGSFTFRRWRKYGHDRLYAVRKSDGVQLGYWNLATDGGAPEDSGLADELAMAVWQWKQANGQRKRPPEQDVNSSSADVR